MDANHGVVTRAHLLALGYSRSQLAGWLRTERLRRLRPGWFATSTADPQVVRAVSAGGALSCLSALRVHGLWVPRDSRLHVRRTDYLNQPPLSAGMVSCRPFRQAPVKRSVDPLVVSLAVALNCHDAETAVALLDSALRQSLDSEALADLKRMVGRSRLPLFDLVDPSAESGIETLTRLRLRRRNIKLRTQVWIDGVGRVDFLVGDRFVIEVDGWEYHRDAAQFQRDRTRDLNLAALGFTVTRLSYQDVVADWAEVEAKILAIIRAGRHRRPRRRR